MFAPASGGTMHRRTLLLMAAVTLIVVSTYAELNEYRHWGRSPQGYFMTSAERAEWVTLKTDVEAERFVAAFLAKRDSKFADEVANRAAQADKYLTIGKLPGSRTLRGKTVILFGPPTAITVNDIAGGDTKRDSVPASGAMTGGANASAPDGGGRGGSTESPTNLGLSITTVHVIRSYRMIFDNSPGGKVDVTIEADPVNGKDRVPSRGEAQALDRAFERAARASIVK
jgi:GWxTD domain-containing protein